ncbi:MAG: DUF288 domain-containing protein [Bacteroidetes bacterium]|nr:DUF288 domain-containing protein [Bacteroidota bacterium]
MKKFIVITSIFAPTEAIRKFAALPDYQLVVVGDLKSPKEWKLDNVVYLGVEDQKKLNYPILKNLPFNHYCRKMLGYLWAIENGAEIIIDTDDDNLPYENWNFPAFKGEFDTIENDNGFVNIYEQFTPQKIWPRGLPLNEVLNQKKYAISKQQSKIGVWQGLANGDPDVDAIYRLVDNTPCTFDKRSPIVLGENTITPFNSQNTAFCKELFPLLYLPAFVTFRFTDILRGLVAQPILWKAGYKLGFTEATVFQDRNAHNYMRDFESEVTMYLHTERVIDTVKGTISSENSIIQNIQQSYFALAEQNIVNKDEINLLNTWLKAFI